MADGAGTNASFCALAGLAVDASNSVWVADAGNHAIRRVSPWNVVATVAGGGAAGYADGPTSLAVFSAPAALAAARDGTVYVADAGNHCIRAIGTNGYSLWGSSAGARMAAEA